MLSAMRRSAELLAREAEADLLARYCHRRGVVQYEHWQQQQQVMQMRIEVDYVTGLLPARFVGRVSWYEAEEGDVLAGHTIADYQTWRGG